MPRVLPSGARLTLAWNRVARRCVALAIVLTAGVVAPAAGQDRDAGGVKAPTVELERGRAIYVLNTCHFCHGVDLTRAQMGAASLMLSPLVGADVQGEVIGAIVRAGFPNLQTSMPGYPDLTDAEIRDLAAYIHYLRQVGRRKALLALADTPGDAARGEAYFAATCAKCHSVTGDLKGLAAKYPGAVLKERLLGPPPPVDARASGPIATGRARHLTLLERYQDADVHNLLAYLRRRGPS